jgi:hypothetical protein
MAFKRVFFLLQIAFDDMKKRRQQRNNDEILAQTDKNMLTLIKNHFSDADTPDFDKICNLLLF